MKRSAKGQRISADDGLTLLEVLVVMLIIGALAVIAIPSFFNQRDKAGDADAKQAARTAATAMESFQTDRGGYDGAAGADLEQRETTLSKVVAEGRLAMASAPRSYAVTITAGATGHTFTIRREPDGSVSHDCAPLGAGGCPTTGDWAN